VGIQAVAKVPRIIGTNNWDWCGDTFGILIAVVDENMDKWSSDSRHSVGVGFRYQNWQLCGRLSNAAHW